MRQFQTTPSRAITWIGLTLVGLLGASRLLVAADRVQRGSTPPSQSAATDEAVSPAYPAQGVAPEWWDDGSALGTTAPPIGDNPPIPGTCWDARLNRSLVLGHLWFGMDIMGWATRGSHVPPLVTSSPITNPLIPESQAGVLGQPQTVLLFGNDTVHEDLRAGGRLTIGWWFDHAQTSGLEWHYFELAGHNVRFQAAAADGSGILARPIINADTGDPDSVLVAYPGLLDGTINVAIDLQLSSTGILLRELVYWDEYSRLDFLVGYRHAHLVDSLRVREQLTSLDDSSGFTADSEIFRLDEFRAINQFDGAEVGLKGSWCTCCNLAVTGLAKIALGASNKTVKVGGRTDVTLGQTTTTDLGGVLALPSNIGRHTEQDVGFVSELGLGLEWTPICNARFSLGYTWFYWSDVARALDHVDLRVDRDQLPPASDSTATSPEFRFHSSTFWAHGLTAGFTYLF